MPVLTPEQYAAVERNVTPKIGAREAAADISAFIKDKNSRKATQIPTSMRQIARDNPVYVHNVGPWAHRVWRGSLGLKIIPACPEGKKYASMPPIEGYIFESVSTDSDVMGIINHEGWEIAREIVGVGRGMDKKNSLVQRGCFASRNAVPSKEELNSANEALNVYLKELVREAQGAARDGKQTEVIGPDHYLAAARLGVKEEWTKTALLPDLKECPGCGSNYKVGIAICKDCHTILDEEKYKTLKRAV